MNHRRATAEDLSQLRTALRTPLNRILTRAGVLLEEVRGNGSATILERVLARAGCLCELVADTQSGTNTPTAEIDHIRRGTGAHARALLSDVLTLVGVDDGEVEQLRLAAYELVAFADSGVIPGLAVDPAGPRVHARGDVSPPEGRLLVVDSDQTARDLLRKHLQSQGYHVEQVEDRRTVLDRLQVGLFDVVLLDLVTLGTGAPEVLHTIQSDPQLSNVAVLMICTADNLAAVAALIQQGAEDYLFKPFDPVLLGARVRATLERKRLRDQERTRNLAFDRVTSALHRSNEDLQRFAYAASHDLQAPLRTVTTYLQLLERRAAARLKEDEREMIGFARGAARRMHSLIQDLLLYSRASTATIRMERLDTDDLVRTVIADFNSLIEEASARVTSAEMPVITGDRTGIRQILSNLLSNALRYRRAEPPEIHIFAAQEEKYWRFCVRDNGEGIPAEYTEQIFEMFKRLHGEELPGSGIGLSICQRIVDRLGGKIWVDSEPGRGSTFCFTIPCPDA